MSHVQPFHHLQPDLDHCKELRPTPKTPGPDRGGDPPGTGRLSCGQSPDHGRDPRVVLGAQMLSMGLARRRGERLWETLRVPCLSRLLSLPNVAARPTIGW